MNCKALGGCASGFSAFDFDELSGTDLVEKAVHRNGFGHQRMIADAGGGVEDGLFLVADGKPLNVFTRA
jgi:hypothetical protein